MAALDRFYCISFAGNRAIFEGIIHSLQSSSFAY